MRKHLENKITMYDGISSLLAEHDSVVQSVPGFGKAVSAYNVALGGIRAKAIEVKEVSAGKTTDKHKAEEALEKCLMAVCSGLYLLASDNGDNKLAELTFVEETHLDHMRDTDLATFGAQIASLAEANAAGIADLGISAEEVADLKVKANAYSASIGSRESGVNSRKAMRKNMEAMFPMLDDMLEKKFDRFMNIAKRRDEEFFNKYQASRIIKNVGIRHRKPDEASEAVAGASAQ